MAEYPSEKIRSINECESKDRRNDAVVADMDGALLIGQSLFPYFALIAFDVGGIPRLLFLLLLFPLAQLLHHFVSESAGIRVLIFATFVGVRVSSIRWAAAAVLPKHFSEELHPDTWRVFSSCGRKYVLTAVPRIAAEHFLKNYLGADIVLGTEISSYMGIATGLVDAGGVLVGPKKAAALQKKFGTRPNLDIGIDIDKNIDSSFIKLCNEQFVLPSRPGVRPLKPNILAKPVVFHDGRLVRKPTPMMALLIILWLPIAIPLSILRLIIFSFSPISLTYHVLNLCGVQTTIKRAPPSEVKKGKGKIFICSHKCVADALIVAAALRHTTTVVTYSVSRLSEFISPIQTCRLTRNRVTDAKLIKNILEDGRDVMMFPEGTTCREDYILRFSPLFAELTDEIVPVAVSMTPGMFHGSTVRGRKWLDPFFFCMNPFPAYEVTFLDKLSPDRSCGWGKSSIEVANYVQRIIGSALEYECTNLTRRDKYRALGGTDGLVGQKPTNVG